MLKTYHNMIHIHNEIVIPCEPFLDPPPQRIPENISEVIPCNRFIYQTLTTISLVGGGGGVPGLAVLEVDTGHGNRC